MEMNMNGKLSMKRRVTMAGSLLLALSTGSAFAADLGNVTVVHDQDVAARTNMPRSTNDTGVLGVTFDADVAQRTNMQRQPGDVAPLKVIQDTAVMERTNMGDSARKTPAQPKMETSSTK